MTGVSRAESVDDTEDKVLLEETDKTVSSSHRKLSKDGKVRWEDATEVNHHRN